MALTAKPVLSANSTGGPMSPATSRRSMNEVTAFDLEVIGRIPEALTGRFLRIGPNPVDEPDPLWLVGHHWFAGAGMAHGLRLATAKPNGSAAASSSTSTPPSPAVKPIPDRAKASATATSTRT